MKERLCLQDHTGDCGGCNVLEVAREKVHRQGVRRNVTEIKEIAKKVQACLCPKNRTMQTKKLRPTKQSIW